MRSRLIGTILMVAVLSCVGRTTHGQESQPFVPVDAHPFFEVADRQVFIQLSGDEKLVFNEAKNSQYILGDRDLVIVADNIEVLGNVVVRAFAVGSSPSPIPNVPEVPEPPGTRGNTGAPGNPGRNAGIVRLRGKNVSGDGKLLFDISGEAGGKGQMGGTGSRGKKGPGGRNSSCDHGASVGGKGGTGGPGGAGGTGGKGGNGGMVEYAEAMATAVEEGRVTFRVEGGQGGQGGEKGTPGAGGPGGPGGKGGTSQKGFKVCRHDSKGPGKAGDPGGPGIVGSPGAEGQPGIVRVAAR